MCTIHNKIKTEVTLIRKGKIDQIYTPNQAYLVCNQGGNKRCGGIGDILAGCVAACSIWNR